MLTCLSGGKHGFSEEENGDKDLVVIFKKLAGTGLLAESSSSCRGWEAGDLHAIPHALTLRSEGRPRLLGRG